MLDGRPRCPAVALSLAFNGEGFPIAREKAPAERAAELRFALAHKPLSIALLPAATPALAWLRRPVATRPWCFPGVSHRPRDRRHRITESPSSVRPRHSPSSFALANAPARGQGTIRPSPVASFFALRRHLSFFNDGLIESAG